MLAVHSLSIVFSKPVLNDKIQGRASVYLDHCSYTSVIFGLFGRRLNTAHVIRWLHMCVYVCQFAPCLRASFYRSYFKFGTKVTGLCTSLIWPL